MRLDRVTEGIPGVRLLGSPETEIASLCYDSRRVQPGDLFAALRGEKAEGMRFVPQAVERGAAALLLEREAPAPAGVAQAVVPDARTALALAARNFYQDPSLKLDVVGITGTNGKTTTSYLVHGVLAAAGIPAGLVGTVQYLVAGQVVAASRTTPESVDLYAMLAGMAAAGDRACVMEVSSHALVLSRVTGIRMKAALFTNLTQDHLDFHRGMEEYFAAKSLLFHRHEVGTAVINRDDPYGQRLMRDLPGALTFGMEGADVSPRGEVQWGNWGSRFNLSTPWGRVEITSPLAGDFNVSNIMGAVAACGALGIPAPVIAEGIGNVHRVPGRFQRVERGQSFTVLVDYAHTPDALEKLLANARKLTSGRVVLVFGCGGDRDRRKRPLMGKTAKKLAHLVFVTSDNPRSEDPERIIDEIMEGMDPGAGGAAVRRISDRREAIEQAVAAAGAKDILIVAGKGHENYQIVGSHTLPFSDADEVARAVVKYGRASA